MENDIRACYFCTTPYQIIGAISLAEDRKEKADLYIVGQFSSFKTIAKKIQQQNIFHNIITINESDVLGTVKTQKNKIIKKFQMFTYYLKIKKIGEEIVGKDKSYHKMYFSSQAFIIRLVYFYFLNYRNPMEFIRFDDGVGSYYNNNLFETKSIDKFLRRILFGNKAISFNYDLLLYMPELARKSQNESSVSLRPMPRISSGESSIKSLNAIFDYTEKDDIKENVIIYDTMKEAVYGEKGARYLEDLYEIIGNALQNQNVIIKSHPRSQDRTVNNIKQYGNHVIPSEVLYLNMEMENKVLITSNSTAVVTPKLLLGKEPTIILLYKIMNKVSEVHKDEDDFFQRFKNTYHDKHKFFIPENLEELNNILDRIKNKL